MGVFALKHSFTFIYNEDNKKASFSYTDEISVLYNKKGSCAGNIYPQNR